MTTTAAAAATPTKLRSGNWGARVTGTARQGDTITITTKAGKTWTATVAKIVWSGNGVTLCATESNDRPGHRTTRTTRTTYAASDYDRLDCGHRIDRPIAGCDFCRLSIGL